MELGKIVTLSIKAAQFNSDRFWDFIKDNPLNKGCVIFSKDKGIDIELAYKQGELQKGIYKYKGITGIPDKILDKDDVVFHCTVSLPIESFNKVNEELRLKKLPEYNSNEEMLKSYLERGIPEELKDKKIYARIFSCSKPASNLWHSLSKWITTGFSTPEHLELIYGDDEDKFFGLTDCVKSIERRKRWNKTLATSITCRELTGAGTSLELRL